MDNKPPAGGRGPYKKSASTRQRIVATAMEVLAEEAVTVAVNDDPTHRARVNVNPTNPKKALSRDSFVNDVATQDSWR